MRQRFEINFPAFSEYVPEAGSRGPVEIQLFNREGGSSIYNIVLVVCSEDV